MSESKESAAFVPYLPKGPPALEQIASAGIRSDNVGGSLKKYHALPLEIQMSEFSVFEDLSFPRCRNGYHFSSPGKQR